MSYVESVDRQICRFDELRYRTSKDEAWRQTLVTVWKIDSGARGRNKSHKPEASICETESTILYILQLHHLFSSFSILEYIFYLV
jgi:hypothetical protein